MHYFKKLASESWTQTWDLVVDSTGRAIIIGAAIVLVSWWIRKLREGNSAVAVEFKDHLVYTVAPLLAVYLVVLVFNFLVGTPRAMFLAEKARADDLQARLDSEAPTFLAEDCHLVFIADPQSRQCQPSQA